ncbi:MAG: helix-turn-helix domain-containing protein [Thermoplasmata archaeon]
MREVLVMRKPVSDLDRRFREFTVMAETFSREFVAHSGPILSRDPVRSAALNLDLAKTVFGKWSIEILTVLYTAKTVGFEDLRRSLRGISARVLSQKLRVLEDRGLVHRNVLPTRPTRVQYSLTPDGLTVAKLGEPVFLYLRYRGDGGQGGGGHDQNVDWTSMPTGTSGVART